MTGERSIFSAKMTFGVTMTLAGFMGYSHAKSKSKRSAHHEQPLNDDKIKASKHSSHHEGTIVDDIINEKRPLIGNTQISK